MYSWIIASFLLGNFLVAFQINRTSSASKKGGRIKSITNTCMPLFLNIFLDSRTLGANSQWKLFEHQSELAVDDFIRKFIHINESFLTVSITSDI